MALRVELSVVLWSREDRLEMSMRFYCFSARDLSFVALDLSPGDATGRWRRRGHAGRLREFSGSEEVREVFG